MSGQVNDPSASVGVELAPHRSIRVAINYGNPVLAQRDAATGEPRGVSVDIAREVGRRLDLQVVFRTFDAAGQVFESVAGGALDLVFLAIDPARATQILFTRPYVIIEGTYLVRANSRFTQIEDLDRPGVRIAVGRGAAYDLFLSRHLREARLERAVTSAGAIDLFVSDGLDAAAGVRQPLRAWASRHEGHRVLDGQFTAIEQAVGVPHGRPIAHAWLTRLVEELKENGFIAASLARSGQLDATVASTAT